MDSIMVSSLYCVDLGDDSFHYKMVVNQMGLWNSFMKRVWPEHDESQVIKVTIIKGKDHSHLSCSDKDVIMDEEYGSLSDAVRNAIMFLEVRK